MSRAEGKIRRLPDSQYDYGAGILRSYCNIFVSHLARQFHPGRAGRQVDICAEVFLRGISLYCARGENDYLSKARTKQRVEKVAREREFTENGSSPCSTFRSLFSSAIPPARPRSVTELINVPFRAPVVLRISTEPFPPTPRRCLRALRALFFSVYRYRGERAPFES